MKSKRAVRTTLYLPYDSEPARRRSDMIMIQLDRHLNKANWRMVVRGRGSRKEHGNQTDLPKRYATTLAVYLRPVGIERENRATMAAVWARFHGQWDTISGLEATLDGLRRDVAGYVEQERELRATIADLRGEASRLKAEIMRLHGQPSWWKILKAWWRRRHA